MHPYIPHLLEDIAEAYMGKTQEDFSNPQNLEKHFEEIENWISHDPPNTFGDYFGLKVEDFPPPDQLSEDDMTTICKAFNKMMQSWNLDIELPDNLPIPIAYPMTVETLNEKTAIFNQGFMVFDYCSGSPEGCAFKEYCPCIDRLKDLPKDFDLDFGDEELPY
ncbi:hypothetical protein [Aquiflexum sp.]|uniref:hypothetical protein n=1 Tax=Aquiflexum sp. TaxID=1872584 RepID=UPI0035936B22